MAFNNEYVKKFENKCSEKLLNIKFDKVGLEKEKIKTYTNDTTKFTGAF